MSDKLKELEEKLDKLTEAFLKVTGHENGYAGKCKAAGCTCHYYVHGSTPKRCARAGCGHDQYDHL